MYAILGKDETTVVGYFTPDISYDEVIKQAKGLTVIQMTPENSPAYVNGTYKDGKFYPPKGNE